MANDFNSVLATCHRFQDIATWDPDHFNANDALARIAELHKREIAAVSAERDEWQKQALEENAALDVARADLAAKDAEIARLRAAIKPVLEVEVKDEDDCKGIGRSGLTTPCAVCDWWIDECEQDCKVLAVFKAAKECQRIYNEREVSNG